MEHSEDDHEERIREIERRLSELDELLAKYIDSTMAYDMNNPRVMSESELQFWTARKQEREMLFALRDRLTKKPT
jgi:alpha-galactosidase